MAKSEAQSEKDQITQKGLSEDSIRTVRESIAVLLHRDHEEKKGLRTLYSTLRVSWANIEGLELSKDEIAELIFVTMTEEMLPPRLRGEWIRKFLTRRNSGSSTKARSSIMDIYFETIRDAIALEQPYYFGRSK